MNITKYAENVENCKDIRLENKKNFVKQYKEKLILIKQHPTLEELQQKLLPSMNTTLPFVSSSVSFSNYVFNKFLNIEQRFPKDSFLCRDLEKEFSENLSRRLENVVDILYHNARILVTHIKEHMEITGNRNMCNESMERFESNYLKKDLTCQDIDWLSSFNRLKIPMRLGKKDYSDHTIKAYKDAESNFSSELKMYGFTNK